jgi:hypothetical protein
MNIAIALSWIRSAVFPVLTTDRDPRLRAPTLYRFSMTEDKL